MKVKVATGLFVGPSGPEVIVVSIAVVSNVPVARVVPPALVATSSKS